MNESQPQPSPESKLDPESLDLIVSQVHDIVRIRSEAFAQVNLFIEKTPSDIAERNAEFRQELEQLNSMTDVFAACWQSQYWPYLNSVDLNSTDEPQYAKNINALKQDYSQLLNFLQENIGAEELDRSKSGRTITCRAAEVDTGTGREPVPALSICERNRPLVVKPEFEVRKRQTFLLDRLAAELNHDSNPASTAMERQERLAVEKLIDQQDPSIIPIHTAYYLVVRHP